MVLAKIKSALNKGKSGEKYITALDIGTEYVKALIGRVVGEGDRQGVEVIGVGRAHQRLSDMHSGAIADIAGVVDNCDKALNEAEDMADVTAKDVVIGIAGELVKGETTTIKYRRPDPRKPIEKPELEHIISKVQQRALERAKAQLAWESGVPEVEIKLVNSAIVNVFIDGYKVNNPIGFQGKDVSVQLFTAFAPMVHIGAIERVAYDLELNLLSVAAEPYAVAKSVGVDMSESFSAVFMDVGGGTTDIALVNDGGVEGTKMFGIGGRSFTSAIAQGTGTEFDTAEKLKLALSGDQLDDKRRDKLQEILKPTVKVWLSGVELALSEFENVDQLPSKILLCGGGAGLQPLVEALKSIEWRHELPFTKEVNIAYITPSQVDSVTDKTNKLTDHTFITPMGLLNVGLDAIVGGSAKQTWMNKLNRALQV
ncbi:rod shape-determining protein [Candidatus Microgenomates bacterium]|nr:rod shape-determining protein [Candidatus Microgenomates bacterium]